MAEKKERKSILISTLHQRKLSSPACAIRKICSPLAETEWRQTVKPCLLQFQTSEQMAHLTGKLEEKKICWCKSLWLSATLETCWRYMQSEVASLLVETFLFAWNLLSGWNKHSLPLSIETDVWHLDEFKKPKCCRVALFLLQGLSVVFFFNFVKVLEEEKRSSQSRLCELYITGNPITVLLEMPH